MKVFYKVYSVLKIRLKNIALGTCEKEISRFPCAALDRLLCSLSLLAQRKEPKERVPLTRYF
jgi:hypothetical protein